MSIGKSASAPMGRMEWGILIILSVIWGASFLYMEVALTELPPLSIVTARVIFAALALHLFLLSRGQTLSLPRALWKPFFIAALFGNVLPFTMIVWGQIYITSSLAGILNATTPFFTLIVAHYFTHDENGVRIVLLVLYLGFLVWRSLLGWMHLRIGMPLFLRNWRFLLHPHATPLRLFMDAVLQK